MPDVRLLLPPNRSALESAVVQALHTQEHPERTLTTLYRADTLDAQLLPWSVAIRGERGSYNSARSSATSASECSYPG